MANTPHSGPHKVEPGFFGAPVKDVTGHGIGTEGLLSS